MSIQSTHDAGCVIVGASHAASYLAMSLRKSGWQKPITIIGEEPYRPYHRPPLSKTFLTGDKSLESLYLRPIKAYEKADVKLMLSTQVIGLDRDSKQLTTSAGETLAYSHVVLAVGARPRILPVEGAQLDGVCYLRDVDDIERIRAAHQPGGHVVVIGGGYIGLEAAATLRKLGSEVTVVEAQERVLERVTSPLISEFFTRVHTEEGVHVRTSSGVREITGDTTVTGVKLNNGETLPASLVVVGIGVVPNVELAQSAGLAVDNGIVVDEFGSTSDPFVFACGDCAAAKHTFYDQHLRLESVQNANEQALAVARNLCDVKEPNGSVPVFWSDQFDVKLQIAGLTAGHDEIVVRGDSENGRKFAAFYLRDEVLMAVDAINSPSEFMSAKKVIATRATVDRSKLQDPSIKVVDCTTQ